MATKTSLPKEFKGGVGKMPKDTGAKTTSKTVTMPPPQKAQKGPMLRGKK